MMFWHPDDATKLLADIAKALPDPLPRAEPWLRRVRAEWERRDIEWDRERILPEFTD